VPLVDNADVVDISGAAVDIVAFPLFPEPLSLPAVVIVTALVVLLGSDCGSGSEVGASVAVSFSGATLDDSGSAPGSDPGAVVVLFASVVFDAPSS